ncbi:phage tail tube protein [Paraburkholderia mimosarum]|uniref:phage tail tube protein n=1 Tax=Paraburkholderia mimosarum TaxID=312026 RepID=UPI0039C0D050
MTSTAISAQGTTFSVSGSAGTAKNITGLALGNPTIVTSAAHGFANGDIVTFAALGGNTTLNGLTCVITNVTTNTFAVNVDTTGGSAYTSGGTATPTSWTPIANITGFKGFDGQANEIDKTNLSSVAKEFQLGIQDFGHFTFDVDKDFSDPGQLACDAAKQAGTQKSFKLVASNGRSATFNGYVKNTPLDGQVDQILKTTGVSIRITGAVTYA